MSEVGTYDIHGDMKWGKKQLVPKESILSQDLNSKSLLKYCNYFEGFNVYFNIFFHKNCFTFNFWKIKDLQEQNVLLIFHIFKFF